MSLETFFEPRSVALIGAAHTDMKLGGVTLRNLLRFRGKVYPVNPKYGEMMGLRAYRTTAEIPEPVDLAVVIRPATEVSGILRELKGLTRSVVIVSAGFSEIGRSALQEELRSVSREVGVRIMGPNCMGVYSAHNRLDTLFVPAERLKRPKQGPVAVVSQSGAILSCLFSGLRNSNIGVSRAAHYGNAVDIDESDIYDYLLHDRRTTVVLSYIESVGDGRRFVEKARELSLRKPLLILKAGKAESGQAAAFSHTGRLAGRYEIFRWVVRQFGLREVSDFDELIDMAKAVSFQRTSPGDRVLILTNAGGSGVLAADECSRQSLRLVPMAEEVKEKLRSDFPDFVILNNPVDFTAQVRDEDFGRVLEEAQQHYDGFLIVTLPDVTGITPSLIDVISGFRRTCTKPVVFHLSDGGLSRALSRRLERLSIPVFPSPERAVRGLRALLHGTA